MPSPIYMKQKFYAKKGTSQQQQKQQKKKKKKKMEKGMNVQSMFV